MLTLAKMNNVPINMEFGSLRSGDEVDHNGVWFVRISKKCDIGRFFLWNRTS